MSILSLYSFLLLLLVGGRVSLIEYIQPEPYLEQRGIPYEAESLRTYLFPEHRGAEQVVKPLVRQLGADTHAEREEASTRLRRIGRRAKKALEDAYRDPDPEIAQRAKAILADLPEPDGDPGTTRLLAMIGLGRLGDTGSAPLLKSIAESGHAVEAQVAREALREINREVPGPDTFSDNGLRSFVRFPPATAAVFAWRPRRRDTPLTERVRNSAYVQEQLIDFLSKTGNLEVRALTLGVDAGMLNGNSAPTLALLEAEIHHDPPLLARWLIREMGFKAHETENRQAYLLRDHLLLMPLGENRLLAAFHSQHDTEAMLQGVLGMLETKREPKIAEPLRARIEELPADAEFRAAFAVPEGLAFSMDEIATLRSGHVHANYDVDAGAFNLSADLDVDDLEAVEPFRQQLESRKDRMLVRLNREDNRQNREIRTALESAGIQAGDKSLDISGSVKIELFTRILDQAEQFWLRAYERRNLRNNFNIRLDRRIRR